MSDDDLVKRLWQSKEAYGLTSQAARRIEALEAKLSKNEAILAKVVTTGVRVRDYFCQHGSTDVYAVHCFNEAIAELKGEDRG